MNTSSAVAQGLARPCQILHRTESCPLPLVVSHLSNPRARLVEAPDASVLRLFDPETGRIAIRELARDHVQEHYLAKSVRCKGCRVTDRCDGIHINMIRDEVRDSPVP